MRKINLTNEGLNKIEQYADKKGLSDVLLLVQILKEVRELKASLDILQNADNSGNNSTCRTDNCEDKNS